MNSSTVLKRLSTKGYDAIAEAYAIDPNTNEICLLSLTGQPDAIKALRACLSIGIDISLTGITCIRWPKNADTFFTVIQKRLPSGAQALLWLPQLGTSIGIHHNIRAFIIQRHSSDSSMPPNFIHILDRIVPCPVLPEWGPLLWPVALKHKWVRLLDCFNCSVWELNPNPDQLIAWIHRELQHQRLPLPPPAPLVITPQGFSVS